MGSLLHCGSVCLSQLRVAGTTAQHGRNAESWLSQVPAAASLAWQVPHPAWFRGGAELSRGNPRTQRQPGIDWLQFWGFSDAGPPQNGGRELAHALSELSRTESSDAEPHGESSLGLEQLVVEEVVL